MWSSFFLWLNDIFVGFSNAWEWLSTPIKAYIESPIPDWLDPIVNVAPIGIIGIGSISVILVAGVLKLIWDAIPIL